MLPGLWRGLLLLALAIGSEIAGTALLHVSEGFTQPWASGGALVGYLLSILLFSRALQYGLPLGVAYAMLTGCGLASATLISTVLFGDPLSLAQGSGLILILIGALILQLPNRLVGHQFVDRLAARRGRKGTR